MSKILFKLRSQMSKKDTLEKSAPEESIQRLPAKKGRPRTKITSLESEDAETSVDDAGNEKTRKQISSFQFFLQGSAESDTNSCGDFEK